MANASDRGPALGDGADEDGKFGGPTKPDSPLVETICRIQRDITNRQARLSLEESHHEAAPASVDDGPTEATELPPALGGPPAKYPPPNGVQGGELAYLGEPDPVRNWDNGKVGSFLDVKVTTPFPSNPHEEPVERIAQKSTVLMRAVSSPVADNPTAPCVVSACAAPSQSLVAQRPTLLIRTGGVVASAVADLPTVGCATDRCPWSRLAEALGRYFSRHVPFAVAVTGTVMVLRSTDPRYPDPRDSISIEVLDWGLYRMLCQSIGLYPRRDEDFPKDLDKALKLIWVEMGSSLREGRAGHFRVRGGLPDQVICEFEESAPLAPVVVRKPSLFDRLLARLKFWR